MKLLDIVKGRFSVRSYLARPVDDDTLEHILEAARNAPSAKNLQDWMFIVVRDQGLRLRLVDAAKGQKFVGEAPVVIACCGIGTDYVMTCGQYSYPIDVAIAMENMSLAAHECGLGTCWLGAFYEEKVKDILEIPPLEDIRVVGLMTLGYPSVTAPPKRRKPLEEIVRYDRWS